MPESKLVHDDLSYPIIGAAMEVLNVLKPGLDEKAYENALVIELIHRGLAFEQQRRFEVFYRGHLIDTLIPDLIVANSIVVDPKVTEEFTSAHVAQMMGYLAITKLRVALLLNFKHGDLRWKRIVR